ncbi:universal stress protein [Maribacter sp. HTCC2170]|uniref:universal stress protein n=1 Tax=Maribacter sp. (strain HTCC2170 / KCCM 42371) TaxID=313603 RepID=UPI00006B2161|nr:universal stress protein [Maribacter sp. HTCC2170]EAR00078.1 putative universal stress protein UspA [Maribacter sp. HTCC2170]
MKNIILPTDFSDNAWNAIFTALKIFENVDCNFILLNTYEPKMTNLLGKKSRERLGVIYDSLSENSNIQLDKSIQYLSQNHKRTNHEFELVSVSNNVDQAINQLLLEREIDLIVMGTKGASGAKEVFMGSNTVRVIKKIRFCPILAVPDEHDFKRLNAVVFPTNFTHVIGEEDLQSILEMASIWNAKINVLQIAEEYVLSEMQKKNKELLSKRLNGLDHQFHRVEMWNNVADAVNDFSKKEDIDLIVLINYPHTFLEKLTRESVIRKMAFHTKIPILILPGIQSLISN